MIVTFFGHRKVADRRAVRDFLVRTIKTQIEQGSDTFYLGGYGEYDLLAAEVVWEMKAVYPHIRSILVVPYSHWTHSPDLYDETLYPPLENVPGKLAIIKRNEYMADSSQTVIAYLTRNSGGAHYAISFAVRKRKNIIFYPNE